MAYQKNNTYHFEKMNVKEIRYTQYSISDIFSDGTSLKYTIDMLKSGTIKPENIKPIRVGKYNGHYRTIDNRRLYCFKQSDIKKIKVKYIPDIGNLPDFRDKYTSNNGGTSIKIRKEHTDTFFYCDVCDINMTFSDKMPHLNGKRHYENALLETFFYCDVCCINMQLSNKISHLNGRRHHQNFQNNNILISHMKKTARKLALSAQKKIKNKSENVKNQNTDNSIKNKKLNCIVDYSDEGIIACALKSVEKDTMVKPIISAKNAATLFYCDVCDTNMRLPDKIWHLNGKRHQKNVLKNQNIGNSNYSIKNKKLNCMQDEAIIICRLKSIDKNTTVTHTKSSSNNKKSKPAPMTNAPIDMKKIVRKPPLSVQKRIKNKSENVQDDKLVSVSQNIKALGSNANNKGIYDVKVRIEPVISYKPKTNNVLRLAAVRSGDNGISGSQNIEAGGSNANNKCFERIYLQLEKVIRAKTQQVNAYKIKCALMQQQIHNYEIKFRKMEQANIAIDIDDIDVDLEGKKEYVL